MPGLGIDTSSPNLHLSSCKLLGAFAGLALSLFYSAQLVLLSAVTACVRTCAMTYQLIKSMFVLCYEIQSD